MFILVSSFYLLSILFPVPLVRQYDSSWSLKRRKNTCRTTLTYFLWKRLSTEMEEFHIKTCKVCKENNWGRDHNHVAFLIRPEMRSACLCLSQMGNFYSDRWNDYFSLCFTSSLENVSKNSVHSGSINNRWNTNSN